MIPKNIFSVWLGEIPDVIKKCVESQQIPGYEHTLITLDNIDTDLWSSRYFQEGINSPHRPGIKFCKLSDYIRMRYLYKFGGIYLDGDVSILKDKNFDDLLDNGMFAARENNGFIGSATVASEPGHPFVKRWIDTVEQNFHGDDDKNFESSMEILTNLWPEHGKDAGFRLYDTHYFYPYDHERGTVEVTPDTRSFHHFMKTWIGTSPDKLPVVSIILPTLGREEKLKQCLDSIANLYYPKHLIELIVLDGEGTVPEKVAKGVNQASGEVLVYAANDMTFEPESLYKAAVACKETRGLVAFAGHPVYADEGNICEHFAAHRDLLQYLEKGELFDTEFHHVGCDNYLWAQAKKRGLAMRCEEAIVHHHHFSTGAVNDEVYAKGWSRIEEDRATLRRKLETLNAQ